MYYIFFVLVLYFEIKSVLFNRIDRKVLFKYGHKRHFDDSKSWVSNTKIYKLLVMENKKNNKQLHLFIYVKISTKKFPIDTPVS